MKLEFDLNEDPGRGNLNLRAYIAAVLGPKRIAHGVRSVVRVPLAPGNYVQLAKCGPQGRQVLYVECWTPQVQNPGAVFRFSSSGDGGQTSVLEAVGSTHAQRYSCVLLPNEQLYAQFLGSALVPELDPFPLVVSTVFV